MKRTITECNRCHKQEGGSVTGWITLDFHVVTPSAEYDLCPDCKKDLIRWIEGGQYVKPS